MIFKHVLPYIKINWGKICYQGLSDKLGSNFKVKPIKRRHITASSRQYVAHNSITPSPLQHFGHYFLQNYTQKLNIWHECRYLSTCFKQKKVKKIQNGTCFGFRAKNTNQILLKLRLNFSKYRKSSPQHGNCTKQ